MQFLNEVKQKAGEFAKENATILLTAGGVVGTVATAVLAGRAGFKTSEILASEKARRAAEVNTIEGITDPKELISPEDMTLTKTEKLMLVGPQFVPPVLIGGLTIGSIIMSHRMSSAKIAGLAAAYGLAERNLSEYKEKVSEKLTGPKKTAIDDEIAQDRVNRTSGSEVVIVGDGEVLCFDEPTGRYFRSTMENIKSAVNATNGEILNHDYAQATLFYEEIGLPATTWTDEVGWNRDQLLELKYSTVLAENNKPCIAIDFAVLPKLDYVPNHY